MKINYHSNEAPDPANLVLDLIRISTVRSPCTISAELIINLHSNGVPTAEFVQLLRTNIKELADMFMTWDAGEPNAMRRLYGKVSAQGGVVSSRLAREVGGESRVRGIRESYDSGGKKSEVEEMEDSESLRDDVSLDEQTLTCWRDESSGCPMSLYEAVNDLLSAGFTPNNSPRCAQKLQRIFKAALDRLKDFRITIPGSAIAFIVPGKAGRDIQAMSHY